MISSAWARRVNGFSLGVMVVSFFRAILEDVTRWIDKV